VGDGNLDNSTDVEVVKKDEDSISRNHIKDNLLDGSQRNTTEEDVKKDNKPQTIQHLLSDWRTAIPSQPKIKQPGSQNIKINQAHLFQRYAFSSIKIIMILNRYSIL